MKSMGNMAKAVCIVLGALAFVGLLLLVWPLLAALGSVVVTILGMMLPLVLIGIAVLLVYKHLQSKDGY